jgi:hypothetical protein
MRWIEEGIKDWRAAGATLFAPYYLGLKAEALYLADRTSGALQAIMEAEALAERSQERWWCAESYRLRGVFLAASGANEDRIEASFCEAIRTAREQKSISLEKRAEGTYAEYRRQRASVRTLHLTRREYTAFDLKVMRGTSAHAGLLFRVTFDQSIPLSRFSVPLLPKPHFRKRVFQVPMLVGKGSAARICLRLAAFFPSPRNR